MQPSKVIWMDGALVPWGEAKVHVLTHSLHYGIAAFEGIRCYDGDLGPAVFRLPEHVRRLFDSMRVTTMAIPYTEAEILAACLETIRANDLRECYIRPLAYIGCGEIGVYPKNNPVQVAVAVWHWGAYLGEEGLERGVRVQISSFTRLHPNSTCTKAKLAGNYVNSSLAKMEAVANGFHEALLLDPEGYVAEGGGENVFIVKNRVLKTPPVLSILGGITRATILEVGRDLGFEVVERRFGRDELYLADEVFFTGTAAEVTPIREVDRRVIGSGGRGPVTEQIQKLYLDIVRGKVEKHRGWLTLVGK